MTFRIVTIKKTKFNSFNRWCYTRLQKNEKFFMILYLATIIRTKTKKNYFFQIMAISKSKIQERKT